MMNDYCFVTIAFGIICFSAIKNQFSNEKLMLQTVFIIMSHEETFCSIVTTSKLVQAMSPFQGSGKDQM
jgi:hypothetical protein